MDSKKLTKSRNLCNINQMTIYGGKYMISNELSIIILVISILALITSCISIILSIKAMIDAKALAKSTHTLQYMPVDEQIDRENKDYLKTLQTEPWASSEAAIKKQNKLFSEDLEEDMPEFAPNDEDKEIHSF